MVLIAIAVKPDSRGPVLFRQRRVGRGGKRFQVLKFRTMVVDAEKLQSELLTLSQDPHWLLLDRDPRVTRVGEFLRRSASTSCRSSSNVLSGEMSLVARGRSSSPRTVSSRAGAAIALDLTPA